MGALAEMLPEELLKATREQNPTPQETVFTFIRTVTGLDTDDSKLASRYYTFFRQYDMCDKMSEAQWKTVMLQFGRLCRINPEYFGLVGESRECVKRQFQETSESYLHASGPLRHDADLLIYLMTQNMFAWDHAEPELKNDVRVAMHAVKLDRDILFDLSEPLQQDRDVQEA